MNGITTRGWSGARIGTKIFDDITRERNSGPMAKVVFIQVKKFPDISPDKQIRYFHRKKKKNFSAFLLNPRCSQYRLSGVSSRLLCPLNQTKTDHLGLFLYMRDEATSGVGRDKMSEMLWLEFLVVLRFWRPMFHHCTPNTFPESAARTHTGAAGDFYLCGTASRPGPRVACGPCCLQCREFLQNNAKF